MNQIICCLKKDIIEIIRNKRIVMFNFLLFGISAMVLITTLIFPDLISILVEKAPDIMSDGTQIEVLMQKLFPQFLKENMGITPTKKKKQPQGENIETKENKKVHQKYLTA